MGATAYLEANGLHSAPDAMSVEYEVADMLYGLVRMLKPKTCVETGCYEGNSTVAIALALENNGFGRLYTCDTNPIMVYRTCTHPSIFRKTVEVKQCEGVELCSEVHNTDFAFLDSSGDRVAECSELNLAPNAVVVVHDTSRPQYDAIKLLRPWKSVWKIETPRGLTVFQL